MHKSSQHTLLDDRHFYFYYTCKRGIVSSLGDCRFSFAENEGMGEGKGMTADACLFMCYVLGRASSPPESCLTGV